MWPSGDFQADADAKVADVSRPGSQPGTSAQGEAEAATQSGRPTPPWRQMYSDGALDPPAEEQQESSQEAKQAKAAREAAVTGVPSGASEEELVDFFNSALLATANVDLASEESAQLPWPCLSCKMNAEEGTATLEFRTEVAASVAICLTDIEFKDSRLGVARPAEYSLGAGVADPSASIDLEALDLAPLLGEAVSSSGQEATADEMKLKQATKSRWYESHWRGRAGQALPSAPIRRRLSSHYEVLGVPRSVMPRELRQAFMRRCLECHPDRRARRAALEPLGAGDEQAGKASADLASLLQAYKTLSDPSKRRAYDHSPSMFLLDAYQATEQKDLRLGAFLFRHLERVSRGLVQRVCVEPRHAPLLSQSSKMLRTRSRGADVLVLPGTCQPPPPGSTAGLPCEVWVAGNKDQLDAVRELLQHCADEADGRRVPADGVVIKIPRGLMSTLPERVGQNLFNEIKAETGAAVSLCEDRWIVRGGQQVPLAVARLQKTIMWRGIVRGFDGGELDAWCYGLLAERNAGQRRNDYVPGREPDDEEVWKIFRLVIQNQQAGGWLVDVGLQILRWLIAQQVQLTGVIIRCLTSRVIYAELVGQRGNDVQARYICSLVKVWVQFRLQESLHSFTMHALRMVLWNIPSILNSSPQAIMKKQMILQHLSSIVSLDTVTWSPWVLVLQHVQGYIAEIFTLAGGSKAAEWVSIPEVATFILEYCGLQDIFVLDVQQGIRRRPIFVVPVPNMATAVPFHSAPQAQAGQAAQAPQAAQTPQAAQASQAPQAAQAPAAAQAPQAPAPPPPPPAQQGAEMSTPPPQAQKKDADRGSRSKSRKPRRRAGSGSCSSSRSERRRIVERSKSRDRRRSKSGSRRRSKSGSQKTRSKLPTGDVREEDLRNLRTSEDVRGLSADKAAKLLCLLSASASKGDSVYFRRGNFPSLLLRQVTEQAHGSVEDLRTMIKQEASDVLQAVSSLEKRAGSSFGGRQTNRWEQSSLLLLLHAATMELLELDEGGKARRKEKELLQIALEDPFSACLQLEGCSFAQTMVSWPSASSKTQDKIAKLVGAGKLPKANAEEVLNSLRQKAESCTTLAQLRNLLHCFAHAKCRGIADCVGRAAERIARSGADWDDKLWKVMKQIDDLGVPECMDSALCTLQTWGLLERLARQAPPFAAVCLAGAAARLDSPALLMALVRHKEDLPRELDLKQLATILQDLPSTDGAWAGLDAFRKQVLERAVDKASRADYGVLSASQSTALVQAASAHREHMVQLQSSPAVLAAVQPSPLKTIPSLIQAFAACGVCSLQANAACAAQLVKSLAAISSYAEFSDQLLELRNVIRVFHSNGALAALPGAVSALAGLRRLLETCKSERCNDLVLAEIVGMLLHPAAAQADDPGSKDLRTQVRLSNCVRQLEVLFAWAEEQLLKTSGGAVTLDELKSLADSRESKSGSSYTGLRTSELRHSLGPLWLEILLARSSKLSWDTGSNVITQANSGRPSPAALALAEALANVPEESRGQAAGSWPEPAALIVRCVGAGSEEMASVLAGVYCQLGEMSFGCPTYQRCLPPPPSPEVGYPTKLYYWEDESSRSWWLGPDIGGEDVWATAPATAASRDLPPRRGWGWCQGLKPGLRVQIKVLSCEASDEHRRFAVPTARRILDPPPETIRQIGDKDVAARMPGAGSKVPQPPAGSKAARDSSIDGSARPASPERPPKRLRLEAPAEARPVSPERPPKRLGLEAPAEAAPAAPVADPAAPPASSLQERQEDRVEKCRQWLKGLDGGKGACLQYLDKVIEEFDADLTQVAASRNPNSSEAGLKQIDPFLWDALGVRKLGHMMLFLKGIQSLQA